MQLRIAEQYIEEFGRLAKAGNTFVVPSNLSDIASMIALATGIVEEGRRLARIIHEGGMVGWLSPFGFRPHRSERAAFPHSAPPAALLHESSPARTMPTDRILTGRCDTTLVGRGRSSDSGSRSRGRPHSPAQLDSGREGHHR